VDKQEFYARPVLKVRDVRKSLDYYCGTLGFTKAWEHGDGNPIIAQVNRNGLDLILDSDSVIPRAGLPTVISLSLHEPEKLGALYLELKGRGAEIPAPPFEVPWEKGLFQFQVQDPDGNLLVFWGQKP